MKMLLDAARRSHARFHVLSELFAIASLSLSFPPDKTVLIVLSLQSLILMLLSHGSCLPRSVGGRRKGTLGTLSIFVFAQFSVCSAQAYQQRPYNLWR